MKKPWRAGWIGHLLGIHSWAAHMFGNCWCQKSFDALCWDCLMHPQGNERITLVVERDDCICCANKHFGRKE